MFYTPEEQAEIDAWIADGETEYRTFANDVVRDSFRYVAFVSNSKGKNRPRKRPIEIELFCYGKGRTGWKSNPPFDDWATEVLPQDPNSPNDAHSGDRLANLIRERCD